MKQFIVGMVVGTVITGSGALALSGEDNPIRHLPVQTQIDRIVNAVDNQFNNISEGFHNVSLALMDIDARLKVLENARK